MPNSLRRSGGNSGTCYETLAKIGLAIERSIGDQRGMSTRSHKKQDDRQIVTQIIEEAAEPRQAASVKKALEKKALPLSLAERLVGAKGGKTRAAKLPAHERA